MAELPNDLKSSSDGAVPESLDGDRVQGGEGAMLSGGPIELSGLNKLSGLAAGEVNGWCCFVGGAGASGPTHHDQR
jgi:hypothetical protein